MSDKKTGVARPVTFSLHPQVVRATLGAVVRVADRMERELAKSTFVPAPGRANVAKIKLSRLRQAEEALKTALGREKNDT